MLFCRNKPLYYPVFMNSKYSRFVIRIDLCWSLAIPDSLTVHIQYSSILELLPRAPSRWKLCSTLKENHRTRIHVPKYSHKVSNKYYHLLPRHVASFHTEKDKRPRLRYFPQKNFSLPTRITRKKIFVFASLFHRIIV